MKTDRSCNLHSHFFKFLFFLLILCFCTILMEKNWTFNLLEKTEEKWSFEKPNFNSIDKTENRKELKETEKEFMDRIKKRMDTRKQLLQKTCKKYDLQNKPAMSPVRFIAANSTKFLFCVIPKAGGTNWKRVFLNLNNVEILKGKIHPLSHPFQTDSKKVPKGMDDYFKLMVVRNPLTRFVSAYDYKMKKYKKNHKRPVVSFDKFVGSLLNRYQYNKSNSRFWSNFQSLCDPCNIDYDVIGKLETIREDSRYVFNLLKLPRGINYADGYGRNGSGKTTSEVVARTLSQIPSMMEKLYQNFRIDYEMFGYTPPSF